MFLRIFGIFFTHENPGPALHFYPCPELLIWSLRVRAASAHPRPIH